MKLKTTHYLILKEIICNEKISVYDISKNLVRDYGNTSRYKNDLLKWNLIHESERVLSATKSEKILYSPTQDGFVIYLRKYLISENLFDKMPEKELKKHNEHIKQIFRKYPEFFPTISANIHDLLFLETKKGLFQASMGLIFPFNVTMRALLFGCKEYLDQINIYYSFPNLKEFKLDIPIDIQQNEEGLASIFEIPIRQSNTEIFENEVIKQFILEPPFFNLDKHANFPENILFMFRISEIAYKSDGLKNLIHDYFFRKELYHSDYEKYYRKLAELNFSIGQPESQL